MDSDDREFLISHGCDEEVLSYIEEMLGEAYAEGDVDGYDNGFFDGKEEGENE